MNCPESKAFLQCRLDGRSNSQMEPPELQMHLAACRSCRELHAVASRLIEGLALMPSFEPPAHLADLITGRVLRGRRRYRQLLTLVTVLAATMLLALTVYSRKFGSIVIRGSVGQVAYAPPHSTTSVPINQSALEVGQAFASLAQRTAGATIDQSRLLMPLVVPAGDVSLSRVQLPYSQQPANYFQESALGVSQGLEPVTSSARRALNLFLREVPSIAPQRGTG